MRLRIPTGVRDHLILPVAVGIVVSGFIMFTSWLGHGSCEISYLVSGPFQRSDLPDDLQRSESAYDEKWENLLGLPRDLFALYGIRIWNSGSKPIKDVNVRVAFDIYDDTVEILRVAHATDPRFEFGLEEVESGRGWSRFRYALLNPSDSDTIAFAINMPAPVEVFIKSEGVKVRGEVWRIPDMKRYLDRAMLAVSLGASVFGAFVMSVLVRAMREA